MARKIRAENGPRVALQYLYFVIPFRSTSLVAHYSYDHVHLTQFCSTTRAARTTSASQAFGTRFGEVYQLF